MPNKTNLRNGPIWVLLLAAFSIILFAATYLPWISFVFSEGPDKIKIWYPTFGTTWLSIRGYVRIIILSIALSGTLIFFRFRLLKVVSYLGANARSILRSIKNMIFWSVYSVGAVVIIFLLVNFCCSAYLNSIDTTKKIQAEMQTVIAPEAYFPPNAKTQVDSGYIQENITDYVQYITSTDGEFDYYPRLEGIPAFYKSKHINIETGDNDLPHRLSTQPNCTPEKAIYCFGGSTTFGIYISDEHTWPSQLAQTINAKGQSCVQVKNYGISAHNASQQTLEFLELLKLGHRPSLAIFLDGINVGPPFDGCEYSLGLAERFETNDGTMNIPKIIGQLPLLKVLQPNKMLDNTGLTKVEPIDLILATDKNDSYNLIYANRLIQNVTLREKIAEMYGVKVISILQPNVFYNCDPALANKRIEKMFSKKIYDNYHKIYSLAQASGKFIDLSNLFNEYGNPAMVDIIHYSPDFNRFLAEKIDSAVHVSSLPDFRLQTNESSTIPFNRNFRLY